MTEGEDEIPKWQREIIEGLGSVLSEVKILQKEVATLKSERRLTVDTGNVSARSSIESASSDLPKISDSIKGHASLILGGDSNQSQGTIGASYVSTSDTGSAVKVVGEPTVGGEAASPPGDVDDFIRRRKETRRSQLEDLLDSDDKSSPVAQARERRSSAKLGDWLDEGKKDANSEQKSSKSGKLWMNAKSKILSQVRDSKGSMPARPLSMASVVEEAIADSKGRRRSAVVTGLSGTTVSIPAGSPQRRRTTKPGEISSQRRQTAFGAESFQLSPNTSPKKEVSSVPTSPEDSRKEVQGVEAINEGNEENKEESLEKETPLAVSKLGQLLCCRFSNRLHPANFSKQRRTISSDFLFRRASSSYLESMAVRLDDFKQTVSENIQQLMAPAIVDQSTVRGLELYIDVNSHAKEFILQNQFPPVVILPDSSFLVFWQFLVACAVVMTAFATPYDAAFYKFNSDQDDWEIFFTIVFCADILMNFITGVRDIQGHVQIKGSTIAITYAKSPWMFLDVISVVPFHIFFESLGKTTNAVKTLKLLRLFRLSKVIKRLDEIMEMGALQVLVLILGVAMFLHWISCGWRLVGCNWMEYATYDDRGLDRDLSVWCEFISKSTKIAPHDVVVKMYGVCLAQACGSMLGSGTVVTTPEQVYFAAVIIMGAVMQASVFGSIAKTMAQMDEERHKFDRQVAQISYRMRYLRLPEKVQSKVIQYYDNLWNFTKTCEANPDAFINTLSPPLRGEMKLALYRNMLTKMPYLRNLDVMLAEALVMKLKSVNFMKSDLIMRVGEPGDWLAFLEEGTAAILDPTCGDIPIESKRIIRVMEIGDYFGEVSLFFGTRRTADVMAMTWTILEILDRDAWDSLKRDFFEEMQELETSIKADTSSWMKSQRK